MLILGINDGHTAAACLYQDGQVRAAIQEERLRRIKNWSGMPTEAIAAVLRMTDTRPEDIDFVALNGHWAAFSMTREQLMEEYRRINDVDVSVRRGLRRALRRVALATPLYARQQGRRHAGRIRELVRMGIPAERVVCVDHHTAHAAAAYYGQADFDDDILVLTCDGAGDRMKNDRVRPLHVDMQRASVHHPVHGEIGDALEPQSDDTKSYEKHTNKR